MLVFEARGKPEYPEKNLLEQIRESTTNSTPMTSGWESNLGHIGERQALWHHCANPNPLRLAQWIICVLCDLMEWLLYLDLVCKVVTLFS